MSSTRLIKRRIKSAQNISQITKAMEMVSASKMKRAQQQALASRPYSEKMAAIIASIAAAARANYDHFLLSDPRLRWNTQEEFNTLVIVLSTDKSLCGGLNTNLFRGLEDWLKSAPTNLKLPAKNKISFITVGKKAKEHILKTQKNLLAEFPQLGDKPRLTDVLPLTQLVMDGFASHQFQMIFVVYMEFISTIAQKLAVKQLLPIDPLTLTAPGQTPAQDYGGQYLFEPSAGQIFSQLLPRYIELQLYHIVIEALASEHSARMVAMSAASDNAADIVSDLTLEFNQARQTKITNELLDVTRARMALA